MPSHAACRREVESLHEFDIEIRNVETRYAVEDHRLVRYEEWQDTPSETPTRKDCYAGDRTRPRGHV